MSGHDAEDTKQSTADMTAFVQNLLQQMQSRFQTMSNSIISKIDEMGNRIEELEQNINELRAEIGLESSPSPSVTEREKSPLRELKPEVENP
ncbi:heat shock factor-binding protein 1 [Vigna radiata var. radiata]|uniref:Heat shock factor-binding protein 1 n=1 Tax=Vigna radiata var. radiata TaxID=3916 RepID=A0A1S3U3A3_VIGRR|nr:heat shock factor-binding protein 1 [Vigna radiata var. radiata]